MSERRGISERRGYPNPRGSSLAASWKPIAMAEIYMTTSEDGTGNA
jgi:hypothetical protein